MLLPQPDATPGGIEEQLWDIKASSLNMAKNQSIQKPSARPPGSLLRIFHRFPPDSD